MNRAQVVELLRRMQAGRSLREFAENIGVSAGYLSDIYCGNRAPGPSILAILGIEKTTTVEYERAKRRKP